MVGGVLFSSLMCFLLNGAQERRIHVACQESKVLFYPLFLFFFSLFSFNLPRHDAPDVRWLRTSLNIFIAAVIFTLQKIKLIFFPFSFKRKMVGGWYQFFYLFSFFFVCFSLCWSCSGDFFLIFTNHWFWSIFLFINT